MGSFLCPGDHILDCPMRWAVPFPDTLPLNPSGGGPHPHRQSVLVSGRSKWHERGFCSPKMGHETSLPPSPSAYLQKILVQQVQVTLFTRRPAPHMATTEGGGPEDLVCCPRGDRLPEWTVGTSQIGNVFPLLLLPYGFLSFMDVWLSASSFTWRLSCGSLHPRDCAKNPIDVPDGTRRLRVKVPAHDSITVASYTARSLGLYVGLRGSPAWQSPRLTLATEWHSGEMPLRQILPLVAELT